MRKIPTLLVRSDDRRHVTMEVTPGCEWVLGPDLDESGAVFTATRKWDGTATMLDADGRWWARREVKPGKVEPEGWVEVGTDEVTGKRVGWEPMENSPFAGWHAESVADRQPLVMPATYELCGPKINGNPERLGSHQVIRHGCHAVDAYGSVEQIVAAVAELGEAGVEGVVWHHRDGRMAKLKARDLDQT